MLNEDEYFTRGPGSCFRKAAEMTQRGDEASFVAAEIVSGLRNDIRDHGGPTDLALLAARAGITVEPGCLPFAVASADELQSHLEDHCSAARVKDRAVQAAYEAKVVQRDWSRLQASEAREGICAMLARFIEEWRQFPLCTEFRDRVDTVDGRRVKSASAATLLLPLFKQHQFGKTLK